MVQALPPEPACVPLEVEAPPEPLVTVPPPVAATVVVAELEETASSPSIVPSVHADAALKRSTSTTQRDPDFPLEIRMERARASGVPRPIAGTSRRPVREDVNERLTIGAPPIHET